MEDSPLQRLPAELRVDIWEYVVKHKQPICVVSLGAAEEYFICKKNGYEKLPLSLTQTCRQIRHESLPLFYKINSFFFGYRAFQTNHPEFIIDDFRGEIGEESFYALRDVGIHLGRVCGYSSASGAQSEHSLYDTLQPAVYLASDTLQHCRVNASVNLMNMRDARHYAVFKLKLKVSNLHESWEFNLQEAHGKLSREKCSECLPLYKGLIDVMIECRDRMEDTGKSINEVAKNMQIKEITESD